MQGPPRVLPRSGPHQLTPALPAQGRAGKGARGLACSPPGPPAGHINSGAESLITIWLFPSSSFQFFRSKGPAQMSLLVPFCQSGRGRQRRGRRVGRASSGLPTPQGGGSGHLSAPRPVGSGHDACGSSSLVQVNALVTRGRVSHACWESKRERGSRRRTPLAPRGGRGGEEGVSLSARVCTCVHAHSHLFAVRRPPSRLSGPSLSLFHCGERKQLKSAVGKVDSLRKRRIS